MARTRSCRPFNSASRTRGISATATGVTAARIRTPSPETMATDDEPGGDHARGASLLSGVRPRRNAVSPYLGATIDQMIANKYGQNTILSSIQLGVEDTGNFGNCNWGYSCAYTNSISWSSPTQPLPTEVNPRVAFERLFGDGTSPEERRAGRKQNASILDAVTRELRLSQ